MSETPVKIMVIELLGIAREQERGFASSLSEGERAAIGTLESWSAKDTVSQIAFWKRLQTGKLQTAQRGEPLPVWNTSEVVDPLNAENYARWQQRSWAEVEAEAEEAYSVLVTQVQRMSEAELVDEQREGGQLWGETLANGIWYPFSELIHYYERREDSMGKARVQNVQLVASERLLAALEQSPAVSTRTRATQLYNTACWHVFAGQTQRPIMLLGEAFPLWRGLMALAQEDSDLDALRELPAFQALYAGYSDDSADRLITRDDLRQRQEDTPAPLLLDVRESEEFSAGHIAGARNISLDILAGQLAGLPRDRLIVAYCNHHHRGIARCEQAAELLGDNGFEARALDGGYPGWKAAGYPVEEPAKVGG